MEGWHQYSGGGPTRKTEQKTANILVNWDVVVGALDNGVVGKRKLVTKPDWCGDSMAVLLKQLSEGCLSDLGKRGALDFILN